MQSQSTNLILEWIMVLVMLAVIGFPAIPIRKIGLSTGKNAFVFTVIGICIGLAVQEITSRAFKAMFTNITGDAPSSVWYLIPLAFAIAIDLLVIYAFRKVLRTS